MGQKIWRRQYASKTDFTWNFLLHALDRVFSLRVSITEPKNPWSSCFCFVLPMQGIPGSAQSLSALDLEMGCERALYFF